ncbi:hypothetical protein COM03_08930 [Bacillus wiedmannii]|nr:hypothetical protein COM03_08930 [Bacillus wiedmannii]
MFYITYTTTFSIRFFHSKNLLTIDYLSHAILKILLFTICKEKTIKNRLLLACFFTLPLLPFSFSFSLYSKPFLPKITNLLTQKLR